VRHRYPFDALQWLRHQRVDRQAAEVSESAARVAHAARVEAEATADRASTEQAIERLSQSEHERLNEGLVRAGELETVSDWRKGAERELERKAEHEQLAREKRAVEAAAETVARRQLGTASNEAKMIDTHHGDWQAERSAAQERSEEEAAAEQWTASHYPPRRG
jgi:hypothetical protein